MSAEVAYERPWPEPHPVIRTMGRADRACRVCGWRFFTRAGLRDHVCEGPPPPPPRSEAAWRSTGLRVAALNNSRRRRCDDCNLVTTPGPMGWHQNHTGHTGWTDAA